MKYCPVTVMHVVWLPNRGNESIERGLFGSLLVIHCSLQKLELWIKYAFKQSKEFQHNDEIMMSLFYLFKNCGKNWRLMQLIAERMSVAIQRHLKEHGTRFQSHKDHYQILQMIICQSTLTEWILHHTHVIYRLIP